MEGIAGDNGGGGGGREGRASARGRGRMHGMRLCLFFFQNLEDDDGVEKFVGFVSDC